MREVNGDAHLESRDSQSCKDADCWAMVLVADGRGGV
jgi:hypothetical protein